MAQTSVPSGSSMAVVRYSVALFAQTLRNPSLMKNMTGPAPQMAMAERKMKNQTSPDMPIVRVTDLSSKRGDIVRMDCVDIIGGKMIMGDQNAEGRGEKLTFSHMEIRIDQATKVVDAGGQMSQQRTEHSLRRLAVANLAGYMPRVESQLCLIHLAGARGEQTGRSWGVPLATDPDFSSIVVNTLKAPTYNRHFTIDVAGSQTELTPISAAAVAALTSACTFKLEHVDYMRALIDDLEFRPQPVKIADDPAAEDEPLYLWLVGPRVYASLIRNTSNLVLRTFQQNAWNRASWGSKHPLFKGEVGIWNNILVRKIDYSIRWAANGSTTIPFNQSTDTTGLETGTLTLPSVSGYSYERTLLLGAQALGNVYGRNQGSDYYYGWLERKYNFERNMEVAAEMMNGKAKVRFSPPDANGTPVLTDHGVFAIDVLAKNVG